MTNFEEQTKSEIIDLKASIEKLNVRVDGISQKVEGLISKISGLASEVTVSTPTSVPTSEVKSSPSQMVRPSDVVDRQKLQKSAAPKDPDARTRCPKCDALQFTEVEDKANVLHYMSGQPIYAKKKVCKKCGAEF